MHRLWLAVLVAEALSAGGCVTLPPQTAPVDPAQLVGQWRSLDFAGPSAGDFESMSLNLSADGTFESGTQFSREGGTTLDGTYRVQGRKILLDDDSGFRVTLPFHYDRDRLTVLRPARIGKVRVTLRRYVWKPPKEDEDL